LKFFAVESEFEELPSGGDAEVVHEGFSMPVGVIEMHLGDLIAEIFPLNYESANPGPVRLKVDRDLNRLIELGVSALSGEHGGLLGC
jgi:hypothetical protein